MRSHSSEPTCAANSGRSPVKPSGMKPNTRRANAAPVGTSTVSNSGKSAPLSGWYEVGTVPVEEFHRATAEGLEAVERALPENPGAAVLSTVRSRIWSSDMVLEYLPEFDTVLVPTGAAFALRVFGFIPEGFTGDLPLFAAHVGLE